ncbi:PQQ-binding-like beta-propeller repeat protein [Streptomyces sp. NPDC002888]|uniref:serine/threonine-protein kinase n=1 Tax=Streptomyces sp. NPDC002888 TaxID=3364668 RepID=UPI0036B79A2F
MPLHRDDPRSLGGYKLVDRLGAGGMGVVYRARSRSGRDVAVKVVHAQYAEDAVFRTRFRQEIEAVRKVSGAFTAPVIDADPEAARPWMATQYVPGRSLAQQLRDRGPLKGPELRRLALGLVEALRDIHRAGVVHRDLKPANVLMAEDGPRVIDFGISRAAENNTLTETGQMIGTPPFMSPEQFTDARSVGPASDVFSLGALLVFATTGRGPFDADSPYLTAYRVVHDEPVLDGVGQPLREILERCLAKEAAERPGLDELAQDFAAALPEPAAGELPTVTLRPDASDEPDATASRLGAVADPPPATRPGRTRRSLLATTGTVGALVLGLTAYLLLGPGLSDSRSASTSESARWGTLPEGWQPWRTTVYGTAASGVKKALGGGPGGASYGGLSCAMGEGSLYCGGGGTLPVRVEGRTGRIAWRSDPQLSGVELETYGSRILGVLDGVLLYSQAVTDDERGDDTAGVVALDADNGKRLWSRTEESDTLDAAVVGDLLLTPDGNRVTARSPRDGTARWSATLPSGYGCEFHEVEGRPYAACTDTGEKSTDNVLVAIDPADGSTRRVGIPDVDGHILGTFDGDLVFVEYADRESMSAAETEYTTVLLIDPDTGTVRKKKLSGSPRGEAALVHGVLLFASSSGRLAAVSPETGKLLWRTSTTLQQPGAPVADGQGRTVYVSSPSGRAAALDAREGTLLWESSPRADQVVGVPFASKVFLDEGALVVLAPDGTVFSLDPAHPERRTVSG